LAVKLTVMCIPRACAVHADPAKLPFPIQHTGSRQT
jgi:hypothetical protein